EISSEVAYLIVHSGGQQPCVSSSTPAASLVRLVRRDLRGRCSHRRHGRLPRVLLVATRSRDLAGCPALADNVGVGWVSPLAPGLAMPSLSRTRGRSSPCLSPMKRNT